MEQISTPRSGIRRNRLAIAVGLSLATFSLASRAADPVFSIVDSLHLSNRSGDGLSQDSSDSSSVMSTDSGYVMNTYHFGLGSPAPGYSATLTDTGLFGAGPIGMTLLDPTMKLLGSKIGSGSFDFTASEPGTYTLIVAGKPTAPAYFDAYAAQVTAVPEAGRTAMLLTGLGLVGLRLRRRPTRRRSMQA